MITKEMTFSEVKEICKSFSLFQKNASELMYSISDIQKLLKQPISEKTKKTLDEELTLINHSIEEIDKKQVLLIKELIDYIFDNKIVISVEQKIEESSYKAENGGYTKFTQIEFVDEIGAELWNQLHENQLFSLYYESTKVPDSHSFKNGMTKEEFIKVLNQYVCEGEAL